MRSTIRADVAVEGVASARRSRGMQRHGRGRRGSVWFLAVLAPLAALAVPWEGNADPAVETRYPYDPACPWGRLANGRGMITRCLGEEEARALLAGGTLTPRGGAALQIPPTGSSSDGAEPAPKSTQPSEAAPSEAAPSAAGPTKPEQPTHADPAQAAPAPEAAPTRPVKPVRVEVGPILPDDGDVSIGKLDKPIDRYRACVEDNGGLQGTAGEVRVHFLVRGERSRAEGVEVSQFRGVTKKAAQCIADVVDRRVTGTPTQPMVGATLVFKLSS